MSSSSAHVHHILMDIDKESCVLRPPASRHDARAACVSSRQVRVGPVDIARSRVWMYKLASKSAAENGYTHEVVSVQRIEPCRHHQPSLASTRQMHAGKERCAVECCSCHSTTQAACGLLLSEHRPTIIAILQALDGATSCPEVRASSGCHHWLHLSLPASTALQAGVTHS